METKRTTDIRPKNLIFSVLQRWAQVFVLNIHIAALWIKNFVLFRKLKIQDVYIYDSVVIDGNQVNLLWDVKGCYKIKVDGIGVLPGNLSGIQFRFKAEYNPLNVTFYGIFRRYVQSVEVRSTQVNVLDSFETNCIIPLATVNSPQISVRQLTHTPVKLFCDLPVVELKFGQAEIRLDRYPT